MKWNDDFDSIDSFFYNYQPNVFKSAYSDYGVKSWAGSDTKENWLNILSGSIDVTSYTGIAEYRKHYSTEDIIEYYSKNPIEYKFNSNGFRDEEFDTKPNVVDVFLGGSYTCGIGLHKKHIWPTLVANKLNFPYINLGIGGSGGLTQYRVLMWALTKFKIRNVFHYIPMAHSRWEWYNSNTDSYEMWNPSLSTNHHSALTEFENISLINHLTTKASYQVCCENSINYYLVNKDINFDCKNNSIGFFARDLIHPGLVFHKILAEKFLKKLEKSL